MYLSNPSHLSICSYSLTFIHLLGKRYHQFQRRMARKYLNGTLASNGTNPQFNGSNQMYSDDGSQVAATEITASLSGAVDTG